MKDDCIFCKIAAKTIPADTVFENDRIIAFNDIHPQAPTHILIVPKKHLASLNELSGDDAGLMGEIFTEMRAIARKVGIADGGWRVIINTNRDAGQEVFHLHVHLMGGRRLGSMG